MEYKLTHEQVEKLFSMLEDIPYKYVGKSVIPFLEVSLKPINKDNYGSESPRHRQRRGRDYLLLR